MKLFTREMYQRFLAGELTDAYQYFGAHVHLDKDHTPVTTFTVYAPNARVVSIVGDFNDYQLTSHKMKSTEFTGVYTLSIPQDLSLTSYKYAIKPKQGEVLYRSDPFAFYTAKRPDTVARVYTLAGYQWHDDAFRNKQNKAQSFHQPLIIYEVHLGSFKRHGDGNVYTYKELISTLIPYALEHGYTHIEFLPLTEHPLDESWGYQITGYYSATSRYGTPHDLMALIDHCHQHNLGVIFDWVPGHFCKDEPGLYYFDGTTLYEHDDENRRENYQWGTANFDLSKGVTQSFLISNALFWMHYYHVDGFRLDAVANIIYPHGDAKKPVDTQALGFLQKLSIAVKEASPHALLIAEDSTSFANVTKAPEAFGLGFDYKWNMGWMNDTLEYFSLPYAARMQNGNLLTFSMLYAYSERFLLPFSHDEVVHGKKTLLNRMPGEYMEKFANYRLLMGYMATHPGKKLLFMGQEFAQYDEWRDYQALDWDLLKYPVHQGARLFTRDLFRLVKEESALHELDFDPYGFQWIEHEVKNSGVIAYIRRAQNGESIIVVLNLTEETHLKFLIGVDQPGTYKELINSNQALYGGSNLYHKRSLETLNEPRHGFDYTLEVIIAPLAFFVLKRSD